MLRNALFQVHWFVGITAGAVLAVVGATGAILSFEPEILHALNRDVRIAGVGTQPPLEPPGLLAALQEAEPDRRLNSLAVWSDPTRAPRVTFAAVESGDGRARGGDGPAQGRPTQRGEVRFLDPRTGAIVASAGNRGEAFFRTTRSVHRWLTIDLVGNRDLGRQIVGACTLLLVFLAASGLYLRWPRGRTRSWRAWLTFNPRFKGRTFLWHLHAISGTWVLIAYLVMSLTGLQWSYEWYRNGLISITGAQPGRARGEAEVGREHGQAVHWDQVTLEAVWSGFLNEVGAYGRFQMAIIDLPVERAETLSVRYLDPEPRHDRAYNTVQVRIADGQVASHVRYDEKAFGDRFMASIFPLHSGRYFGIVGVIVFMVASLAMPLFAITGWMLYLGRRQQKKRVRMQMPGEPDLGVGATRPDIALEVDG